MTEIQLKTSQAYCSPPILPVNRFFLNCLKKMEKNQFFAVTSSYYFTIYISNNESQKFAKKYYIFYIFYTLYIFFFFRFSWVLS